MVSKQKLKTQSIMNQYETSQMEINFETLALNEVSIPSSLKFVIANMKNIVSVQLTGENYSTSKSQILKLFRGNRFRGFLDGTTMKPQKFLVSDTGVTTASQIQSLHPCGQELGCRDLLDNLFVDSSICPQIGS